MDSPDKTCHGWNFSYLTNMRFAWNTRQHRLARAAAAVLMLALWLVTSLLIASPQLHQLIHKAAASSLHDCLVTHLAKSEVLLDHSGAHAVAPLVGQLLPASRAEAPLLSLLSDYRLSPSRAPPSVRSSSTIVG